MHMEHYVSNVDAVKRVLDFCGIGYSMKNNGITSFFFCMTSSKQKFNIRVDSEKFRIWTYLELGVSGQSWVKLLKVFENVQQFFPQIRMELTEDMDVSWFCDSSFSNNSNENRVFVLITLASFISALIMRKNHSFTM